MNDIEEAKRLLGEAGYTVLHKPKTWCKYKEVPIGLSNGYTKDRRDFGKFYDKVWIAMADKDVLSPGEYKFLVRVLPFCEMNTNCLMMKKDNKMVPMGFADLVGAIGYEEKQARRLLKSVTDKNLMCQVYGGHTTKYAVNPELYWKGGDMSKFMILKTIFYTNIEELKNSAKEAKKQMRTLYLNGRASTILYEKRSAG